MAFFSYNGVPLVIMETDGSFRIVDIPVMSETAFQFFKELLEQYKPAIVRRDSVSDVQEDSNAQEPKA